MRVPMQRTPALEAQVSTSRIVHHIQGAHVRPDLPEIVDPYVTLAKHLDEILDPGPEKTTALRKLLESCDAATRCRVSDLENQSRDQKVAEVNEAVSRLKPGVLVE